MKKYTYIFVIACTSVLIMNCTSARVLKKTDTSAVIHGIGPTEFEAKENAMKEAEKLLGEVKQTQEPECNQEIKGSGKTSGTGAKRSYKSSTKTYHSCVLYFEKK